MKKALAVLALATVSLTGCSMLPGGSGVFEETFTDYASAKAEWRNGDIPSWIPDDFTRVRSRATTDGSTAMVEVLTATPPVGDCTEASRIGEPTLSGVWQPEELPDEVLRCGEYEIIPVEGGWFGWYVRSSAKTASSE
jgi:hypothetical protein